MELFFAEHYWPDVTRQRLQGAVDELWMMSGSGALTRVLAVLFTPDDECVFYLLEGESEAAVSALVAGTGRPADRVQRCQRLDRHAASAAPRLGRPFQP